MTSILLDSVRALGHAPLVLRTVVDNLRDDPAVLGLQISRRLPLAARVGLGRLAESLPARPGVVLGAVGLAAAGRHVDLLEHVEAVLPSAGAPDRVRLADVLTAAQEPDRAQAVLDAVPVDTPGLAAARARVAWHRGDVEAAISLLGGTGRDGVVRARLASEVRALRGGALPLPRADRDRAVGYRPRPGSALFVLTNSLPHTGSGYAQRSHSLACALRDEGWHVEAVTRLGWPVQTGVLTAARRDMVDGIVYHRLLPSSLARGFDGRLAQHARMLLDLVLERRPAVLHTTTHWVNAVVTRAVAEAVGVPWVYEVRGQLADTWASTRGPEALRSDRYALFTAREDDAVRSADGVVTLGEQMARRIAAAGMDRDAVVLSPNGVGGAFLEEPAPREDARRRLGLSMDDEIVGTVSSVVPYEGLDDLVRAVAALVDERPRLRLAVVGDGVALPALRRLAADLGIEDRLLAPGRVDRSLAPVWHQALDVFCVPRKDTGVTRAVTPMKPLEAMATSRPVLVSDLPALSEIVEDGVTGRVLPAEEPEAWAAALAALLDDPAAARGLGARAREWVLGHRTWAANARRYDALYRRLGVTAPSA